MSVEEEYQCSGVCSNPGFYVFSNVNNGKPKTTCKDAIVEKLNEATTMVLASNVLVTGVTALIQLILYIIFVNQIFQKCCKKCCQNLKKQLKKAK